MADKQGRGLDPAEIKQDFRKQVETHVYRIRMRRFFHRVDVKAAIGVGDFETWQNEFEWGFARSAPGMSDDRRSQPYGRSPQNRPKLRKVSREFTNTDAGRPTPGEIR